ncbi:MULTISPECIES: hypothetical protein [Clostridium]|uniref:Uncharacterized protein n=2 Tax=Clostridium TaxID=1485 RepID=M1MJ10_9CLOT|nr:MULTISPECIES: hypothetical protein [Clostridium]AGF54826.1 hypothetical protein Cspa_c10500 [Clostridium saccharoperbutylacetonicum N1-4(HMT)]MBC2478008.1 hypothetical protein [Clostridium beijerinckii]NRT64469.1 hypothetical protein [Clostridium saccharoperbutylacetonicum]NSB27840.1 hypothetical protein [Clostridium saccharoperbutylacetonicum]NSB41325.1 hypothetical protein [Clostridium saccharoperbutylacetonicum]
MHNEKNRNNANTGNNSEELLIDISSSKSPASDTEDMLETNNSNISRSSISPETIDVNDDDDDD